MAGRRHAVAVDAKKHYQEIDLGSLNSSNQTWNAPYRSDWAIAVGSFGDGTPTPTFVDVPLDHWAYDYIEILYQQGYVAGCSSDPLMYCPEGTMTRGESAVFVERGIHGAGYTAPTPSAQIFDDVPLNEWFAKWAVGLWEDGYTAGCGTNPLSTPGEREDSGIRPGPATGRDRCSRQIDRQSGQTTLDWRRQRSRPRAHQRRSDRVVRHHWSRSVSCSLRPRHRRH